MTRRVPFGRLPDAGMPARIVTPKISAPKRLTKPKGIYTKGPISSQGVRISAPKPKPRSSTTLAAPKIKLPTRLPSGSSGGGGIIQLPGASPGTMAAISGLRSNAQLRQMASEAVHLESDPQLRTLEHSYNLENQDYGYIINSLRKQLGLSTGDIKTMYGVLDANLALNAKDQAKISADTKAKMGQIYDQLSTQLGSNYDAATSKTNAELNRLGITNPQADDRLVADKALLQGQAAQSKTNSSALQDAINASTQGMMSGLRAGSASTSAMLQSGLRSQFDKESGDALQKHIANLSNIKMQKMTLTASLPAKINQTYQALLDQQYQREMDAAQKLFDNQIKLGNYQLSVSNSQANQQYRQNQLALDAAKLSTQQSMAAQQKVASLKGSDKALAYLQQVSKTSKVPYSTLENILIEAINGDPNRPTDLPGYNKAFMSGYASDINNFLKQRGMGSLYTDVVRAMNYWFGG
jgi:hypothetical protein